MPNHDSTTSIANEVRALLSGLRWRIRTYVWLDGLCIAAIWLAGTFWAGLAVDYLPVLLGANEMPRLARVVLLGVIAAVLGLILYRWVLRRAFVRLGDRSMAVLIERQFKQFSDSLVTSVEMGASPASNDISSDMLARTLKTARQQAGNVRLANVFNFRPLIWRSLLATALVVPVGLFYATNVSAWELFVGRIYLLRDDPWPRSSHIEIVGFEPQSTSGIPATNENAIRPFRDRVIRAARGSNIKLVVRADALAKVVPEICTVYYRIADGNRGWIHMNRIGRPRDDFQLYEYSGTPFSGILDDIEFDVVGYDHRLQDYRVITVDSPEVVAAQLECEFPEYMVDEKHSLWLPRTIDITPGLQLPRGTKVVLKGTANKPLQRVLMRYPDSGKTEIIEVAATSGESRNFQHPLGVVNQSFQLELNLHDVDDVVAERPHRIHISSVEDQPPLVNVRLSGIGSVVTPDVLLPVRGTVQDDYGIAKSWLEMTINKQPPNSIEFGLLAGGKVEISADFREFRNSDSSSLSNQPAGDQTVFLKPTDKLVIQVKAQDRFDLADKPNEGGGDRFELDVVTADQLLSVLEGRELALRRRLEQIIEEMTETRDSLVRTKSANDAAVTVEMPEDSKNSGNDPAKSDAATTEALDSRARSLRLLRAQRALLQCQKSAQETLGVAAAIRDIRDELTNNRVDTEDRKQRLTEQIADPLQRIGESLFTDLEKQLTELSATLERLRKNKTEASEADAGVDQTVAQTNEVLRELQNVLSSMLDLETYNELLDIVRSLIEEQDKLTTETKKQQKKQALDLLK